MIPTKEPSKLIPKNFEPGWNVIIYNSDTHGLDELEVGLINSEVVNDADIGILPNILESQGYACMPFYFFKQKAEKLTNSLKEFNVHVELVYTQINEYNIDKLRDFMIDDLSRKVHAIEGLVPVFFKEEEEI